MKEFDVEYLMEFCASVSSETHAERPPTHRPHAASRCNQSISHDSGRTSPFATCISASCHLLLLLGYVPHTATC